MSSGAAAPVRPASGAATVPAGTAPAPFTPGVIGAASHHPPTAAESDATLRAAFARAALAHPAKVSESYYLIAGRPVTVRLVGDRLGATLTRAIDHLRVAQGAPHPHLVIEAWDEDDTGITAPGSANDAPAGSPGSTSASSDGRYVRFEQARTTSVLDRVGRRIVARVAAAHALTQYELGRPWHSELLLWQHDAGLQPIHAGCIERDGHGVLLAGPGGSGKSTTSLACMQAGWAYLADDYVGVERTAAGRIVGHGAYSSAHLDPTHLLRFPALAPGAIPGQLAREDKSLLLLSTFPGVRLAGAAEIRLIAFPRVVDRPASGFRPAATAEALLRLAPSSMLLLPYAGLGHAAFRALSALVAALPTFWFDVGRDLAGVPTAMNALLHQVTSQ